MPRRSALHELGETKNLGLPEMLYCTDPSFTNVVKDMETLPDFVRKNYYKDDDVKKSCSTKRTTSHISGISTTACQQPLSIIT